MGFHYLSSRWVPHCLDDLQKSNRVRICSELLEELKKLTPTGRSYLITSDESWFFHDNPHYAKWASHTKEADTRPRRTISSAKTLVAVFWSFRGFYYAEVLPRGTKYNADFVITKILPGFEASVSETRPVLKAARTKLHWDNARPHCASKTRTKLAEKHIILLPHPAYSPDVAPSDFFLFGYLKDRLQGATFQCSDELLRAITDLIASIPQETLDRVFDEWMHRLEVVVASGGEYYRK